MSNYGWYGDLFGSLFPRPRLGPLAMEWMNAAHLFEKWGHEEDATAARITAMKLGRS